MLMMYMTTAPKAESMISLSVVPERIANIPITPPTIKAQFGVFVVG